MKTFLWFFTVAVLCTVYPLLAEPLEDTYEAELMQKYDDMVSGKKNDTPKNPISKFISAAKKKLARTISKDAKSNDDSKESPFSSDFQSDGWPDSRHIPPPAERSGNIFGPRFRPPCWC